MEAQGSKRKNGVGQLVIRFSKGRRYMVAVALTATVMSVVFAFLSPLVMQFTLDNIIGNEPILYPEPIMRFIGMLGGREGLRKNLLSLGIVAVVFAALAGFSNFLRRSTMNTFAEGVIKRLRDKLYSHIQELPFEWHVKNQTGEMVQRCTSDVDVIRTFLAGQVLEIVNTLILVTVALTIMFNINLRLSIVELVFLPVILLYTSFYYSRVSKEFIRADEAEGELMSLVQENLTGVRVVRAFGREKHEMDKFDEKNEFFCNKWLELGDTLSYFWSVNDIVTRILVLAIIVFACFEAAAGRLTLGQLVLFVTYNAMIVWPVRGLGRLLSEASKSGVSAGRILEILDEKPESDPEDAKKPEILGNIRFEGVTFSYGDGQEVLRDVSFEIGAGETLAILGGTGSGKSTVIALLCRLYDLGEGQGRITVDGVDIREIDRKWLRRHIAVVLQEPFIFSRSVLRNIGATNPEADLSEVRRHAKAAHIDRDIMELPLGYDTIVGERGVTLSGGQRQRVAIARMLMQDSPVCVMDDSLSAVDTETDLNIRTALKSETGRKTMVIISHRITTLMDADKIIVMGGGHVIEEGTHDELVVKGGIYSRVYDMQTSIDDELLAEGGER